MIPDNVWCLQLNREFDAAMMAAGVGPLISGVLWCEGAAEIYCMGREL